MAKTKKPAVQVAVAKKAAALKAASEAQQRNAERVTAIKDADLGLRLLSKPEVLATIGVSFPTLWLWMRAGKFPRSRIVGGKSMWRSDEITAWLAALPLRPLKGDPEEVVETAS